MLTNEDYATNNAAYQRMKDSIQQKYPKGWFVGISAGKIAAAAANFDALQVEFRSLGIDPRKALVVEAGVAQPEFVNILPGRAPQ